MDPIRVLVFTDDLSVEHFGDSLTSFESSSEFVFQTERCSLQNIDEYDVSKSVGTFDPQVLILFVTDAEQKIATIPLLQQKFINVPILAVIKAEELESIFKILELGLDDFVTFPVIPCEVKLRIRRLVLKIREDDQFDLSIIKKFGLKQLVGQSEQFISEMKKIPLLAKCDATVLLTGETGTGKELCARAIHYLSPRCQGPFIPVNCGAIPADLVENELFGHERGAFTGASVSTTGLIQEAERGTIFLDEIDCLPLSAQVKLLRFLQEKEYRPLGSMKIKRADVRLLAAMNVGSQEAVETGKIRQDLYYRLNVIPLVIPPLRKRKDDIPMLARHFLEKYAVEFDKPISDFSTEAMQLLLRYDWPGNVRELEHVVERVVVLSKGHTVQPDDVILPSFEPELKESFHDAKIKMITAFEKTYIERLLLAHRGNITQAARAAQKNRRAFWELVRKHQIDTQHFKS